jgi:hypothetical protein
MDNQIIATKMQATEERSDMNVNCNTTAYAIFLSNILVIATHFFRKTNLISKTSVTCMFVFLPIILKASSIIIVCLNSPKTEGTFCFHRFFLTIRYLRVLNA